MSYPVVIVDDEIHQLESLKKVLENFPDFHVAGTASSIGDAEKLFEKEKPKLAFLDVELPPHTSFELLARMTNIPFKIIFTTAYDKYALQAIRFSALDYLLKPVSKEDVGQALGRFKDGVKVEEQMANIKNLLSNFQLPAVSQKIALPTLTGFLFVAVKDIVRCESDNTYTTFFTIDKNKIIVSRTLKEVEQMLVEFPFFRVHNSHLINLDYVTEYIKGEGGIVKMEDGAQVDVSRRRKDEFLQKLKKQ